MASLWVPTLAHFPWVKVRVACILCPHRKGEYRLVGLAARFGPRAPLHDVLKGLSRCRYSLPERGFGAKRPPKYAPRCGIYFVDLESASPPPPDLPAAVSSKPSP
ncbi:hypothetical protein [Methylobacterium gnaphalii]|uniref:Uncharacterized protein n=1 Tax=Methylobacterium gnaphalii TaxID=1010610 RepID=A0A512JSC2_9HYPH|nr:hypothetical protein [Methylobacterium gnaphalii]GEP12854.1 hypothetical protein MGN01_46990 [Methylobacterium gnaphalii]GJD70469.1 hypothetical protein MMMDOFMJ_3418 [Methylobacterium gnaphalii]